MIGYINAFTAYAVLSLAVVPLVFLVRIPKPDAAQPAERGSGEAVAAERAAPGAPRGEHADDERGREACRRHPLRQ